MRVVGLGGIAHYNLVICDKFIIINIHKYLPQEYLFTKAVHAIYT